MNWWCKQPKRKMKVALLITGGFVVVWMLGDFIYSRVVASRAAAWEATIKRDEDGVREGCREYSAGEGSTAFLLIHGINDSPALYRKMAPKIVAAGNHVRVTRLPGFAKPLAEYAAANRRQWVEHVRNEVSELRKTHDRVFIAAHSLGGAVTLRYLLQGGQEQVDGVILMAPAIGVSNTRSPLMSTRAWHEVGRFTLLFTRTTQSPFDYDAMDPDVRNNPYEAPFAPRSVVNETFALIDANRQAAGELRLPVLMILAENDHVVDNAAAEEYFESIAAKSKRKIVQKESAHAIPLDYGWEEATKVILNWSGQVQ